MRSIKKKPVRGKKVKAKVSVKQKAKLRKKGSESAKYDTLSPTPMPHDNAATLKLKIRKK